MRSASNLPILLRLPWWLEVRQAPRVHQPYTMDVNRGTTYPFPFPIHDIHFILFPLYWSYHQSRVCACCTPISWYRLKTHVKSIDAFDLRPLLRAIMLKHDKCCAVWKHAVRHMPDIDSVQHVPWRCLRIQSSISRNVRRQFGGADSQRFSMQLFKLFG